MQKEIVTLENIKQDLIRQIRADLLARLATVLLVWFILVCLGFVFLVAGRKFPFITITAIALMTFAIILFRGMLQVNNAKRDKFMVKRDIVAYKYGHASEIPSDRGIPQLFFLKGDSSPITYTPYYKWTGHPRSGKTIFDLTDIGDSFILVKLNKRVWVVYNERFFTAPWL